MAAPGGELLESTLKDDAAVVAAIKQYLIEHSCQLPAGKGAMRDLLPHSFSTSVASSTARSQQKLPHHSCTSLGLAPAPLLLWSSRGSLPAHTGISEKISVTPDGVCSICPGRDTIHDQLSNTVDIDLAS
jgi:hypothetical protein